MGVALGKRLRLQTSVTVGFDFLHPRQHYGPVRELA